MSDFLDRMKAAAKADKKTIVLPEGEDPRTIEAAKKIVEEDLANLVILGDPAQIDVPGVTVIDPATAEQHEAYAAKFAELRAKKGVTIEQAREQMNDATYFGTMMVKMGDADGLVSGACHSTANTLRPALQILKTAPGTKLVSAFFIMCTKTPEYGADGTLLFADCGLNIDPTADELSEIAIASAESWKAFMPGEDPKVAMLSFSTMGSAKGEVPAKVQEAVKLAHEKAPELSLDGDLQLDAALVQSVADLKAPGSTVAGNANILVFPDPAGHRQAGQRPVPRLLRRRHRGRRRHHRRPGSDGRVAQAATQLQFADTKPGRHEFVASRLLVTGIKVLACLQALRLDRNPTSLYRLFEILGFRPNHPVLPVDVIRLNHVDPIFDGKMSELLIESEQDCAASSSENKIQEAINRMTNSHRLRQCLCIQGLARNEMLHKAYRLSRVSHRLPLVEKASLVVFRKSIGHLRVEEVGSNASFPRQHEPLKPLAFLRLIGNLNRGASV